MNEARWWAVSVSLKQISLVAFAVFSLVFGGERTPEPSPESASAAVLRSRWNIPAKI